MAASDIEIARAAKLEPIVELARERLRIEADALHPYGHHKAKLSLAAIDALRDRPDGKLILVTSISPTPAGEGKTTTVVGLGDGLAHIGKNAMIALREPSLGPCFGIKGGAAGGGRAQVVPMEDINLHFTGDMHAIAVANNLLAAMIDNHVYWGNGLGLDARRVTWRRVMDVNERALRTLVCGLGGPANGFPREDHFDITAASEVMAVFCLADGLADLERRLAEIVVGERRDGTMVRAGDLEAQGAMSVLLKDAIQPNLVQTLEHTPAFVHGGPFANIAHGCNSVLATRTALKLADYVVTEAGFGADLGAEKFYDITCRMAGFAPALSVLVVTARALKMHGGAKREDLKREDPAALEAGLANLRRHIDNLHRFGVPVICAINRFESDSAAELASIEKACAGLGVEAVLADHFIQGGKGAAELARAAVRTIDQGKAAFKPLYDDAMGLWDKARTIARDIYGAADIAADATVHERFAHLEEAGFARFPVCMAKTQASFSTDPTLLGAPEGHTVTIRELRLSAGAGFVVAVCGDIMTMPGLPKSPAAERIRIDENGLVQGLF